MGYKFYKSKKIRLEEEIAAIVVFAILYIAFEKKVTLQTVILIISVAIIALIIKQLCTKKEK